MIIRNTLLFLVDLIIFLVNIEPTVLNRKIILPNVRTAFLICIKVNRFLWLLLTMEVIVSLAISYLKPDNLHN